MGVHAFPLLLVAGFCSIAMNTELYQRFKQLKSRGSKSDATEAMRQLIRSLQSFDAKKAFTDWFFTNEFDGTKVRHELYESILFPVLLEGYRHADPLSIKRLAETDQNLYAAKMLWAQLKNKSKSDLLHEYLELCPDDLSARHHLLETEIHYFRYCEHEWPAGILYGHNGATMAECDEILQVVNAVRKLDLEERYTVYIDEFTRKVQSYRERLAKAKGS